MKRTLFLCLIECLTATFALPQSNRGAVDQTARVASPVNESQTSLRARAMALDRYGKWLLGFKEDGRQIDRSMTPRAAASAPAQLFSTAVSYDSGGQSVYSVAVADVNGDRKPDLLVANACASSTNCDNGSLGVLLGNGDGTFQSAMNYASGGFYAVSVAVADVNGDGKPDLIVANACASSTNCLNSSVAVLLGNGDGTFQAALSYDPGGLDAQSVVVADVNGDGKPDLVVTLCALSGQSSCGDVYGGVGVLLGNGDGTFQAAMKYNSGAVGAKSVAVADVNGDGKPDLLVANLCISSCIGDPYGDVGVLLGNGDGTFQAAMNYGSGGFNAVSVAVADLNGNGKPDLILANENASCDNCGSIGVLLGNGDGIFQTAAIYGPSSSGGYLGALALADFNGDGMLDVASGAGNTVLLGNGDGTLQSPLPLGAFGYGIAVGDFNRDGRPDVAVGAFSSVNVLLNISPLSSATTLTSSANPSVSGKMVTFTALVSSAAGTPTGKIEFLNGTTVLATLKLTSDSAQYTTRNLPPGGNSITALYLGDSIHNSSASAPLNQFVLAATATTLSSSPNPSAAGQSVVFTATVTSSIGAPPDGETVTFKQWTTVLGTGMLSGGSATFTTSTLKTGTDPVRAVYDGDSRFASSKSEARQQVVNKAAK